ncbi:MinD/ParA family protein [Saccharibacillus sp. CPCC 101409]|uniref:MinD/ParA family protein n=1 Tax=Saccharibacillus sp. CPCC 101409 TaxID=3058041 RepID=UPI0026732932|nr:MinD/ParA family protein [Saccharibacillus sp. CPCC 101409]MDO3410682.1 MinD/ParA family protein [Saccharibacillus sp. CPCC 101409]
MSDQAAALREMISSLRTERTEPTATNDRGGTSGGTARIVAVTSGKGGVGKSNFTLNFALELQKLGRKVLVFDADIGMANIDVLMGVRSQYNLIHLLKREKSLTEIIQTGPNSLPFIAGGSGFTELFSLSEDDLLYFTKQIEEIAHEMDVILFDTGAGLSKETIRFITASDECIVVTTPEPTAITDAYALVKVVHDMEDAASFRLVVNRASDRREAQQTSDKIRLVAEKFLHLDIPVLGYVSDDPHVSQAVKKQTPFSIRFPNSQASKDIQELAFRYTQNSLQVQADSPKGIKRFIRRLLNR